jgi:predicted DNA-binding transcriptional regulator YafY
MRRIERLINLIAALLETSRPMTASEIREEIAGYGDQQNFEAFRRAFERDKEALRNMGIPVEVVEIDPLGGEPEGYIIPKSKYYLQDLDLDPDELAALRLVTTAMMTGEEQAEGGLLKLSVGDSGGPWTGARVTWGADVAAEQPLLGPLYSALIDRVPISFTYRAASGEEKQREIETYGLVHRKGNWYLVGRDRARDGIRAFKVSRISGQVKKLEGTYDKPTDFNAAEHLSGEAWEIGSGTKATATVRFDADLDWWVEQNMPQLALKPLDRGGVEVEMPFANLEALISWALGFGEHVEIVSPPEARAAMRDHVASALEPSR